MLREDFLHFLWKTKSFNFSNLKTTKGKTIQVIDWGIPNTDAGPDFLNAKVKIDDELWAGSIEMHVKSSDWNKHGHQGDPNYNTVILHVLWEDDQAVCNAAGKTIPTLTLKEICSRRLYERYHRLKESKDSLPCSSAIHKVNDFHIKLWMDRLFVERLEEKIQTIYKILSEVNQDWESCLYYLLAKYFGMTKNKLPFIMLARSLPLRILWKHKDSRFMLEALLYGQAGMLHSDLKDPYPVSLRKEYRFLKYKYKLKPQMNHTWNFLRMRPAGFPTVRISQFAHLLQAHMPLVRTLVETQELKSLKKIFSVQASKYWKTHYTFDKESKSRVKNIGSSMKSRLIINVAIPFLYAYAKYHDDHTLMKRTFRWMRELPKENNKIIRQWSSLVEVGTDAYESQALLQLHQNYCLPRRCMECSIGCQIMKQIYTVEEKQESYLLSQRD